MNSYEIWVDLAPGVHDLEFVEAVQAWLDMFVAKGQATSYRIRRRKFGFGPSELGEFIITIDFDSLAQMDEAFLTAATRDEPGESLHREVYRRVTNYKSGLFRDFPDAVRTGR